VGASVSDVFVGLAPVLATLGCIGLLFVFAIGYGRYKHSQKSDDET
jgi:hypothetical protein